MAKKKDAPRIGSLVLPSEIKLGTMTYRVVVESRESIDRKIQAHAIGLFDFDGATISIAADLCEQAAIPVLVHEVLHAVFEHTGVQAGIIPGLSREQIEGLNEALAHQLIDLIQRNPKLVDLIQRGVGGEKKGPRRARSGSRRGAET